MVDVAAGCGTTGTAAVLLADVVVVVAAAAVAGIFVASLAVAVGEQCYSCTGGDFFRCIRMLIVKMPLAP